MTLVEARRRSRAIEKRKLRTAAGRKVDLVGGNGETLYYRHDDHDAMLDLARRHCGTAPNLPRFRWKPTRLAHFYWWNDEGGWWHYDSHMEGIR
jgi:hypothetical protein